MTATKRTGISVVERLDIYQRLDRLYGNGLFSERTPGPLHAMSMVSIILLVGIPGSEAVGEEAYEKKVYIAQRIVYTCIMGKRLIDIDEPSLEAAQAELGTATIKATVNEALRLAGVRRNEGVRHAFEVLGNSALLDRDNAWR